MRPPRPDEYATREPISVAGDLLTGIKTSALIVIIYFQCYIHLLSYVINPVSRSQQHVIIRGGGLTLKKFKITAHSEDMLNRAT